MRASLTVLRPLVASEQERSRGQLCGLGEDTGMVDGMGLDSMPLRNGDTLEGLIPNSRQASFMTRHLQSVLWLPMLAQMMP